MDYNTTYDPNLAYPSASSNVDPATTVALTGAVLVVLFIFFAISYAISAFLLGRIFKKAGVPQWIAWVPFYNTWKMLELGNQQGFWAVLALIPFVNIVSAIFTFIAMFHIGKKFGKEDWFVLLAIFLPLVWMIWLAFDDSKWQDKKIASAAKTTKKAA
jgi:hypothetical protein